MNRNTTRRLARAAAFAFVRGAAFAAGNGLVALALWAGHHFLVN